MKTIQGKVLPMIDPYSKLLYLIEQEEFFPQDIVAEVVKLRMAGESAYAVCMFISSNIYNQSPISEKMVFLDLCSTALQGFCLETHPFHPSHF